MQEAAALWVKWLEQNSHNIYQLKKIIPKLLQFFVIPSQTLLAAGNF